MNARWGQFWTWFDRALLVALAAGVGLYWWEAHKISARLNEMRLREPAPEPEIGGEEAYLPFLMPNPVARFHAIVSRFARQMDEAGSWPDLPANQTTDMREENGRYELALSLPRAFDEKSVKVSTAGNVLSLTAALRGKPRATFVRQFYIPFPANRIGAMENSVSNSIVHITIQMKE